MVHPSGRLLQYGSRIEVQVEDKMSVKNAKVHPKGISFTANNMALVYLLDEAGARSTSDMFHDLYATNIVDTLFRESCPKEESQSEEAIQEASGQGRAGWKFACRAKKPGVRYEDLTYPKKRFEQLDTLLREKL